VGLPERVRLRPFRADELDQLHESLLSSQAHVVEVARERLKIRIARSGRFVEGRLDLAVEVDGKLAGTVDVRCPEGAFPPGVCEIGVELFPELRGDGLGTETVELLAERLRVEGFARVQASTDLRNDAMRRVLEKTGFALEGRMRGFMPDGEVRADYALYARVL
jgi:RimJ/RimL family protein N-acetyltransferase